MSPDMENSHGLTSIGDLIARLEPVDETIFYLPEQVKQVRHNTGVILEFTEEWLRAACGVDMPFEAAERRRAIAAVDLELHSALLALRRSACELSACLNRRALLSPLWGQRGYTACLAERYDTLTVGLRAVCQLFNPGLLNRLAEKV